MLHNKPYNLVLYMQRDLDNKTFYESPDIFCFLKSKHDFRYLHTKSATSLLQGWTEKIYM